MRGDRLMWRQPVATRGGDIVLPLVAGMLGMWVAESTPRPTAMIEFVPGPPAWKLTVEVTVASGARYAIPLDLDTDITEMTRNQSIRKFIRENWIAAQAGHFGVVVYGVRGKEGKTDEVAALTITVHKDNKGQNPVKLTGTGEVKAQVVAGNAKPAAKPLPAGPKVGPENFVEFDFSPVPDGTGPWRVTLTVETTLKDFKFRDDMSGSNPVTNVACESLVMGLNEIGFKAEVVDRTKVRVYGGIWDGQFYPATEGRVESAELKKDHLPKVTNPPKT
jgi:hypothetical protein